MSNVVELDAMKPHQQGPSVCLLCGHITQSVAPVGMGRMQCSRCQCLTVTWAGNLSEAEYFMARQTTPVPLPDLHVALGEMWMPNDADSRAPSGASAGVQS